MLLMYFWNCLSISPKWKNIWLNKSLTFDGPFKFQKFQKSTKYSFSSNFDRFDSKWRQSSFWSAFNLDVIMPAVFTEFDKLAKKIIR